MPFSRRTTRFDLPAGLRLILAVVGILVLVGAPMLAPQALSGTRRVLGPPNANRMLPEESEERHSTSDTLSLVHSSRRSSIYIPPAPTYRSSRPASLRSLTLMVGDSPCTLHERAERRHLNGVGAPLRC